MKNFTWLILCLVTFLISCSNTKNDELLSKLSSVNEQLNDDIEKRMFSLCKASAQDPHKVKAFEDLAVHIHDYSEKLLLQIDDEDKKHEELQFLHRVYVDSLNSWRRKLYKQDSLIHHSVELKEDRLFRSAMKNRVLMNQQIFIDQLTGFMSRVEKEKEPSVHKRKTTLELRELNGASSLDQKTAKELISSILPNPAIMYSVQIGNGDVEDVSRWAHNPPI